MKTTALILSALMSFYGLFTMFNGNFAGTVPFLIGPLSFCIIQMKSIKNRHYDPKSFMNK